LVAAILAIVTLSAFYRLQDSGPESAIRRFNQAIKDHDKAELKRVSIGVIPEPGVPSANPPVVALVNSLAAWYRQGAEMKIEAMDRSPDEVRAAALFTIPSNPGGGTETSRAFIWVVVRQGSYWYVDGNQTAMILADNPR